ncbi:hypothetical protein ACHAXS_004495 [Conticribra weissflogii]
MGLSNLAASKLCLLSSMSPSQLTATECEETVSSSWSQTDYFENMKFSKSHTNFHQHQDEQLAQMNKLPQFNPFYFFQNCLVCLRWPSAVKDTYGGDCFFEAKYSSAFIDVCSPPHTWDPCLQFTAEDSDSIDRDYPQDLKSQSCNTPHHQRAHGQDTPFALYSPPAKQILSKGTLSSSLQSSQSLIRRRILMSEENSANKPPKLTPLTIDSIASVATSSLNTLHRRTHLFSIGFFTAETFDKIYAPNTGKNGSEQSTPGTHQRQEEWKKSFEFDGIEHRGSSASYISPQTEVRGRANSETFRNNMKMVTCQKKPSNDDVSPIGSDDGFSTCFSETRKDYHMIGISYHSRPSTATRYDVYRSRPFDFERVLQPIIQGQHSYDSTKGSDVTSPKVNPKADLLGEFSAEDSKQHENECNEDAVPFFGMSFFQSIHSLILQSSLRSSNEECHGLPWKISSKDDIENQPKPTTTPSKSEQLHKNTSSSSSDIKQDMYLRKCPSFLKLLRKSGHKGKCLIQGWVAFRRFESWEEITRHPKRSDFRHIVLLDDKPLLYMFKSKSKQKKGKSSTTKTPDYHETSTKCFHDNNETMVKNHEIIEGCTTLELTDDIAVRVKFVSKELGNSICLRHVETGQLLCGMLPLNIPSDAFLDKHHSRLKKGDSLRYIFLQRSKDGSLSDRRNRSAENDGGGVRRGGCSSGEKTNEKCVLRSVVKSKKSGGNGNDRVHVETEQYDVARHLLFVLDAAIKFPLPRQSTA